MRLLERLERRFHAYAIPHLTVILIIGQVLVYFLLHLGELSKRQIALVPADVLQGEFWRLATFIFTPPVDNVLFAFFAWYIFYLMGSALEAYWGEVKYNLYIFIAYAATLAAAFLTPELPATNAFIGGSVFLAFAFLYPNFQLYLFFILPVKVKWLAMITWVVYGLQFIFGAWQLKLLVAASVCNFVLFFGRDIFLRVRAARHAMATKSRAFGQSAKPLHRCVVCGRTNLTDRDLGFRYCTDCEPEQCFCEEHEGEHRH